MSDFSSKLYKLFAIHRGSIYRSTSAKPAVRRSPQQRTSQVHLAEVRDSSDTSNLYTNS